MAQFFHAARGLFILLWVLSPLLSTAQVPSGCWQGLEVAPQSAYTDSWPSVLCLSISGNTVTGTLYQVAARNQQYFVEYEMTGSVQGNVLTINHNKVLREKFPPGSSSWCFGQIKLTYDPNEEKLTGTAVYKTARCGNGTFELYRIALKTADTFCKGADAALRITGKNVKWYAEPEKKTLLAEGNTFTPILSQTTTFYVTQTQYGIETPPVPIKIEIVELTLVNVAMTPAKCGKTDGTISVSVTGGSQVQYSLNSGPFQSSPVFSNLSAGAYTVNAKVANCHLAKDVIVSQQEGPLITALNVRAPTCGKANGEIQVVVNGGKEPLSYSIDGANFQAARVFSGLVGKAYTVSVKDANGCVGVKTVTLTQTSATIITGVDVTPTTCGRNNGSASIRVSTAPASVQYSLDSLTFQAAPGFTNLKAGTYTGFIRDASGCTASRNVQVMASSQPEILAIQTEPASCATADGRLAIRATGTGKLSYSLGGTTYQSDPGFSQLPAGAYELSVKDEANCLTKQIFNVAESCQDIVSLPTTFTPNGDGINDHWTIFFPFASLQLQDLRVFNRWGEVVYRDGPLLINSGHRLWNGFGKGDDTDKKKLVSGAYAYQLTIQFATGKTHVYRGTVNTSL